MPIQVGDKLPDATFKIMSDNGPRDLTTAELCGGKTVVMFALPGAFTPTCSAKHLPGYIQNAAQLRDKGVDVIACLSVNDAFVMGAWGHNQGAGDNVMMLADGNADFTKAIGLEMDASGFGMGTRSQRYAMVVEDGTVKVLHVEEPGTFEVSSAEAVIAAL